MTLASIQKMKESAMLHSKVCDKSEIIDILLCQSVTFQALLSPRHTDFVPLTLIIPLSLYEISFHACTDDHNGFLSELQTSDWPQLLNEPEASNHPIYAR